MQDSTNLLVVLRPKRAEDNTCEMPGYIHHTAVVGHHHIFSCKSCISATHQFDSYFLTFSIPAFFLASLFSSTQQHHLLSHQSKRLTAFSADFSHLMQESIILRRTWRRDKVEQFSTAPFHCCSRCSAALRLRSSENLRSKQNFQALFSQSDRSPSNSHRDLQLISLMLQVFSLKYMW